jgi:hypothetical protein
MKEKKAQNCLSIIHDVIHTKFLTFIAVVVVAVVVIAVVAVSVLTVVVNIH